MNVAIGGVPTAIVPLQTGPTTVIAGVVAVALVVSIVVLLYLAFGIQGPALEDRVSGADQAQSADGESDSADDAMEGDEAEAGAEPADDSMEGDEAETGAETAADATDENEAEAGEEMGADGEPGSGSPERG